MTQEAVRIAFLGLILGAVALEVLADVLFKKWSVSGKGVVLGAGMAIYALGTLLWAYSLRYEHLSKAIAVFTVLNFIAVVLVGVLVFKESLSAMNVAGIVLGVASVVLLSF